MIRFIFFIAIGVIILLILNHKSKQKGNSSNLYKNLIIFIIIIGLIFLLATSGRFILPQILQFIKLGLPFLTKFIGI
tara:strand:- start:3642 stop:3872 length:231 start_codon:yes stop_codon:yes gene_type:complete